MSSTFGGLEMGKSALNAFRLGMQTVGHNISNMNTEGYSRQRVIFSTVTPENIEHVGQLGQGMYASTIERIRDEFLDFQFRDSQATLGYWEKINDLYDSIQNYIAEPNSTGLRSAMDDFFTNMQTLQRSPEDTSARRALVEAANSIGGMLTNLISNFNTYNESINLEVKQAVEEANQMLYDLAALNKEIATAEALDQNANDLYDQRDLIIDKLSKMMDIQYNEPLERNGVKGEFFLSVNGRVLVQGTHVRELKAHTFMWDNQVYYDVQVAENEFDIVDNPSVAEALATGAEGTYQLSVDRIANGEEWTIGGANDYCLETKKIVTSQFVAKKIAGGDNTDLLPYVKIQSSKFENGIVLNENSDTVNSLSFTATDSAGNAASLDMNIRKSKTVEVQTSRLRKDVTSVSDDVVFDKYSEDKTYTMTFSATTDTTGGASQTSTITIKKDATTKKWEISNTTTSTVLSSDTITAQNLRDYLNTNVGTALGFTATLDSERRLTFKANDTTVHVNGSVGDTFDTQISVTSDWFETTEKSYWKVDDGVDASNSIVHSNNAWDETKEDLDITTLADDINTLAAKQNPVALFTATADTTNNLITFDTNSPLSLQSKMEISTDSNGILGTLTNIRDPQNTLLDDGAGTYNGTFTIQLGDTTSAANSNPVVRITVADTDTLADIRDRIKDEIETSYSSFKNVDVDVSIENGYLTFSVDIDDVPQEILIYDLGGSDVAEKLGLVDSAGDVYVNDEAVVLDSSSDDIPYKLSFRVLDENQNPSVLTVKIDKKEFITDNSCVVTGWQLRAELDGEEVYYDTDAKDNKIYHHTEGSVLTLEALKDFINDAVADCDIDLEASTDDNALVVVPTADGASIEVSDYSGMLGAITETKSELLDVNMRVEPQDITDALNISGSFRIQVGTQGTRVTSSVFRENPSAGLGEGEILGEGEAGESHTFRVGVSGDDVDFTAVWNAATKKWVLTSDLGTSVNAGSTLTVKDLSDFMTSTFKTASSEDNPALVNLAVTAGKSSTGTYTQFYIESRDNHLLSITDVDGNLAERMGIANQNPIITIDVESSDSLVTIRNKINEKYQAEFGLTEPEQWVHASVDNGYLEIAANVAGEAQRITLMGSEDGNMQVLLRLGLTGYKTVSEDASFSLNGVRYLSSDNKINMARRIPAEGSDSATRYSATELSEINPGMWLNLKNSGNAVITVRHHIREGSIKGLEEARDEMIPNLKSELDEMAYGLVKHINALQYSGYGVAGDITTTGVAFFDALSMQSGASEKLKVTDRVSYDPSLIGAAMGLKDENGYALKGVSGGSGDGTNASRMNDLNFSKVLENGTMTISGIYDAMLSQIGSEASHAALMYKTQATVSEQIDGQRQAVSGVNIDEELMDMVILNRAFGAMSRYITTMDEMLNTIINGMGLVGR